MLINITKINLNPNVGGGKPIELENKEITITENGTTTVTPSEGFGGMSNVNITTDVPTPRVEANKSISITENGAYSVTPSDGYVGVGDVDISVFVSEIGTSIDFSEIGYDATDNANANMIIQDGIEYAKQIQSEYTDSKTYKDDNNLAYFPNVDTSNRQSCHKMFYNCSGLEYVPALTISNTCNGLYGIFFGCGALEYIDTTNWNTSNIDNLMQIFEGCKTLKKIIGIENWDTGKATNLSNLFSSCYSLKGELNLSGWNTSKVSSMSNLFNNCSSLTSLNISGWNLSKLSSTPSLLSSLSNLQTIDVSNINFGTLTKPFSFNGCGKLTNIIGIENWNTSNFTDLKGLFYSCYSLTSLDLSNWNTSSVTSIAGGNSKDGMFRACNALTTLNISGFDTSRCTTLQNLFKDNNKLTNIIGVENLDVQNVTNMGSIFSSCNSLINLNLSGWDVSKATSLLNAFSSCTSLTNFQAPQNINATISFTDCNNLTVDSLLSILNNLTDKTGTTSLTCNIGSTNLAKLTDEQKAIATSKNWVLA